METRRPDAPGAPDLACQWQHSIPACRDTSPVRLRQRDLRVQGYEAQGGAREALAMTLPHLRLLPLPSPTSSASVTASGVIGAAYPCASSGDEPEEFFPDPAAVPSWLCRLLNTTYFQSCPQHRHLKKSDTLYYCIQCQTPQPGMCQHCKWEHDRSHCLLQVRRYVYQDVVRLADIAPYFCPSQIQAYVINGAEVVFLRPRPSSKVPDRQDEKIEPCRACGRHCRAPTTFCSLTCKVQVLLQHKGKIKGTLPPEGFSLPTTAMAPFTPPRPMRPLKAKPCNLRLPRQLLLPVSADCHCDEMRVHRRKQPFPKCAPY